jgi:hypothetical protein
LQERKKPCEKRATATSSFTGLRLLKQGLQRKQEKANKLGDFKKFLIEFIKPFKRLFCAMAKKIQTKLSFIK